MSKKNEENNNAPKMTAEQIKSSQRTRKLAESVFRAIKETAEATEEDFTTFEILDVLLRVGHRYNQEGLKQQYNQES